MALDEANTITKELRPNSGLAFRLPLRTCVTTFEEMAPKPFIELFTNAQPSETGIIGAGPTSTVALMSTEDFEARLDLLRELHLHDSRGLECYHNPWCSDMEPGRAHDEALVGAEGSSEVRRSEASGEVTYTPAPGLEREVQRLNMQLAEKQRELEKLQGELATANQELENQRGELETAMSGWNAVLLELSLSQQKFMEKEQQFKSMLNALSAEHAERQTQNAERQAEQQQHQQQQPCGLLTLPLSSSKAVKEPHAQQMMEPPCTACNGVSPVWAPSPQMQQQQQQLSLPVPAGQFSIRATTPKIRSLRSYSTGVVPSFPTQQTRTYSIGAIPSSPRMVSRADNSAPRASAWQRCL